MSRLGRSGRISTIGVVVTLVLLVFPPVARSDTTVVTTCDGVQPALDVAQNGDIVRMNIATLCATDVSITLPANTSITLEGAAGVTTGFQPEAAFGGPLLQGDDILDTTIKNLTITGVNSSVEGSAISITGKSAPHFDELVVQNNSSNAPDRSPVVINNGETVPAVTASAATGSRTLGIDVLPIVIEDSYFGGAELTLGNHGDRGGALHIFRAGTPLIIRRTLFMNNTATERGGGLDVSGTGAINLTNVAFRENEAVTRGGGFHLAISQSDIGLLRVILDGNDVEGPGHVEGGGGVLALGPGSNLNVMRSMILNNTVVSTNGGSTNGGGLKIQSDQSDDVYLRDTTMWRNHADGANGSGGGLFFVNFVGGDFGKLNMINSIIVNNSLGVDGNGGGLSGICVTACPGQTFMLHNTIVNNTTGTGSQGNDVALFNIDGKVYNTIVYSTGGPNDFYPNPVNGLDVRYSDICGDNEEPIVDNHSICDDPVFVNEAVWNYHQRPGSPTVDRASAGLLDLSQSWVGPYSLLGTNPRLTKDFEGDARVIDANADGQSRPDMGADELIGRSRITVELAKTPQKVNVDGRVIPKQRGEVTVTLYEKRSGSFDKIAQRKDDLSSTSKYEVSFNRSNRNDCKVTARFGGSATNKPTSKSKTFAC